ncbi:hypothetical protein BCR32DRAFT_285657 [Anaeromyces robustus]|uniref:Uncharacterized protein n=1 Tax=Anaeromyces robustus TaxID=1754192 RepID=A0A1Y1WIR5_9FUNG|nr:hypothetical protein BCR32DRAFT_285657 [Anaeromyces robustus]|eukprot:ORX73429.1 hypothetical protein BCR32DRAFT_285657 [Anaeromyces robustus]
MHTSLMKLISTDENTSDTTNKKHTESNWSKEANQSIQKVVRARKQIKIQQLNTGTTLGSTSVTNDEINHSPTSNILVSTSDSTGGTDCSSESTVLGKSLTEKKVLISTDNGELCQVTIYKKVRYNELIYKDNNY